MGGKRFCFPRSGLQTPGIDRTQKITRLEKKVWRKILIFLDFRQVRTKKIGQDFQNFQKSPIRLISLYVCKGNVKGNQANRRFLKILKILTKKNVRTYLKFRKINTFRQTFFSCRVIFMELSIPGVCRPLRAKQNRFPPILSKIPPSILIVAGSDSNGLRID